MCEVLQKEGINCNITLIFGFVQAVAAAQAGAHLISPFPGRVLDYVKSKTGQQSWDPSEDPGVVVVHPHRQPLPRNRNLRHGARLVQPKPWAEQDWILK